MNETPFEAITKAVEVLARTYREHTSESPRLVFHTLTTGGDAIAERARFGDGLADDLIPLGATAWVRLAEKWLASPR